jgi:integrase
VFANEAGEPWSPNYVSQWFRKLRARAGVPALPLHALRHTAASAMLAAGVPLEVVSRRLGHRRVSTTADTYYHLLPESDRAAAERFDAWLEAQSGDVGAD